MSRKKIGSLIHASLLDGAEMKLFSEEQIETIKSGKFIVIEGNVYDYFSIITDLKLAGANDDVLNNPPRMDNPFMFQVLSGTMFYTVVSLKPMLMYEKTKAVLEPVKTIPPHFASITDATDNDIEIVFGNEGTPGKKYFHIGTPLDMQQPVCLDLERLSERSSAIFGRTGTGKTFITRLLLAGFIKTDAAVNLIFDVHNEYGTSGTTESNSFGSVKGLQPLFASQGKVKVYSLDAQGTKARGAKVDKELRISTDTITPEDILLLRDELDLSQAAADHCYIFQNIFKRNWLKEFFDVMDRTSAEIQAFAEEKKLNNSTIEAMYRKLQKLKTCQFLDFNPHPDKIKVIEDLIDDLQKGTSVVIEFGGYDSMMAYLLVANIVTRRVEERYKELTDTFMRTRNPNDKPKQLVITVEEAHKFLNTNASRQTSFGKIARELRKYYVSLLIVDQRPSGIDDEILSQIGTKIVAALSDEKDINAVLSGVSNSGGMRSIIAGLDSKQQVLLLGHGVPMPVVIRTREYNEKFYEDMGSVLTVANKIKIKEDTDSFFPN